MDNRPNITITKEIHVDARDMHMFGYTKGTVKTTAFYGKQYYDGKS